jgi:predicted AlkP superfamily phosphohydrolase/phosphomutase/tetratricopeptide (TPR) repeat protein
MLKGPRRRLIPIAGALLAVVVALVLIFGRSSRVGDGRVMVLALDGMDPQTIDTMMAEGKLPNFAKLRQEGAYGRLQSSPPLLSPVIWTTVATGKTPDAHGIGHFVAVSPSGESLPVTSRMRKVKAIWNVMSDKGRKVAAVGWWATWPAETVRGAIVSDHTCYHFLFPQGHEANADPQGVTHPPELFARVQPLVRRPSDVTFEEASAFIRVTPEEFNKPFSFDDDVSHFKWALATADSYRRIGLKLWKEEDPDLLLTYIEATDSTSHLFGHLFRAQGLSGELARQQEKFGHAVEAMYVHADRILGEYMAAMDGATTLIVLSDHGFELGALQDDPTKTRDMRRVSERFHREQGILYLYGRGVKAGGRIDQAKLVDVVPTILALSGLPRASDMPGRALAEVLTRPIPGPQVASYEAGGAAAGPGAADANVDPQILERLRSLGYVGDAPPTGAPPAAGEGATRSPQGERNLAGMMFEQGRHQEAADAYRRLVALDPEDATLRTSLAGALGALGRYDEAMKELDAAIAIEPLNVEAYHNRGAVFERRNDPKSAIEEYRRAVRYNPQYEPSRRALQRLTGSADVNAPRTEGERQAAALAQEASQAARRGDYAAAMRLLDEAEKHAPRYVMVHQYRSNVAYLAGDTRRAMAALETALSIEPDNALFKANLERLRRPPSAKPR